MPEKMAADEIKVERISESHRNLLAGFKSHEKELVDFLLQDALSNQDTHISTTHLWIEKQSNKLIGYITLLADALKLESALKAEFRQKGIHYKSLPALKIGRLCVDDGFRQRGVGTMMVDFTYCVAAETTEKFGCRFLTVDAKKNPDPGKSSLHFYRKLDFKTLKEREKGTTPLYKDVSKIIDGIRSRARP